MAGCADPDARHGGDVARPRRGRAVGLRDQVGRRPGAGLRRRARRSGCARATISTSRSAIRNWPAWARPWAAAARCWTVRWSPSAPTAGPASPGCRSGCTSGGPPTPSGSAAPTRSATSPSTCCPWTARQLSRCPTAQRRELLEGLELDGAGWQCPPLLRRQRPGGAAGQPGAAVGGRGGQAAEQHLPARAGGPRTGARSRTSAPRRSSSSAGSRATAGGPAPSARSWSAYRAPTARGRPAGHRPPACATPARSGPASPRRR